MLEPQKRWQPLTTDLRALLEDPQPAEYLVVIETKRR
jgi:hypothetical protein